ncbi:DUF4232 domain-containing protein [Arthrobacter sp. Soil763]|uniref:DUF4232 domain-containing protein n=1 Tax=Arthrobacter sp. Soil763 TaxID=1736402 RepID=UPI000A80036F|nr:DUF4232 domain-containing protein [Arthrobacter sp. Soil763]
MTSLAAAAAAAAALLLSGCATSQPQGASNAATGTPPSASASESAAETPAATADGTTSAPPSSAAATTSSAAGPARCKAAHLTASLDSRGGGAAGSVYIQLILKNTGTEPCLLQGYPGVSLTAGASGEPIGAAAKRDESAPATDVLLAPGKAGKATLRYTQAANYPDCTRTPAAGFRVYPPEDTASLFVPAAKDACWESAVNLLTIGAFTAL